MPRYIGKKHRLLRQGCPVLPLPWALALWESCTDLPFPGILRLASLAGTDRLVSSDRRVPASVALVAGREGPLLEATVSSSGVGAGWLSPTETETGV